MAFSNYIPICDAIVSLMQPLVEVVIHEIASNTVVYINGGLSVRKVGDLSLLDKGALSDLDQIVYPKISFDGRLLKSISVVIEDKWLLCINCDISLFSKMQSLSETILQTAAAKQPSSLFINDWQERVHMAIHEYLKNNNLSLENLSSANKNALVQHLFDLGAFNEKNAADYVAKILNMGRATVFKYLKEVRKK